MRVPPGNCRHIGLPSAEEAAAMGWAICSSSLSAEDDQVFLGHFRNLEKDFAVHKKNQKSAGILLSWPIKAMHFQLQQSQMCRQRKGRNWPSCGPFPHSLCVCAHRVHPHKMRRLLLLHRANTICCPISAAGPVKVRPQAFGGIHALLCLRPPFHLAMPTSTTVC